VKIIESLGDFRRVVAFTGGLVAIYLSGLLVGASFTALHLKISYGMYPATQITNEANRVIADLPDKSKPVMIPCELRTLEIPFKRQPVVFVDTCSPKANWLFKSEGHAE